jgi:hypothetical protein
MIRSFALISTSVIASAASAGFWTVGSGLGYDFTSVAEAMSDNRVQDGHTVQIFSGLYDGFDTGSKSLVFEPGNSPGIVNFVGDVRVRAGSQVNFELAGYDSGLGGGTPQFDQFIVAGNANYLGILGIRLLDGFMPVFGDSWALIQAGGTISFSGLTDLPQLDGGLSWNVQVVSGSSEFGPTGSSLVVSVVPTPGALALVALAGLITNRRRR